jgi:hypothetical protein
MAGIQIPVVRCKNTIWEIASKFRNIQIYVSIGYFVHALNHVELFGASRNSLELSEETTLVLGLLHERVQTKPVRLLTA